jgi:hypothetical protein
MSFSSMSFSSLSSSPIAMVPLPPQPASPTLANAVSPNSAGDSSEWYGDAGFAADTGDKIFGQIAQDFHAAASELRPLSKQLTTLTHNLGDLAGPELQSLQSGVSSALHDLRAGAHEAESVAGGLHGLGKVFEALDAGGAAVKGFEESDSKNLGGKLGDAVLSGGSKLLAGAAWPIAAVDSVTGGAVSDLYHAGGKAVEALGQAATGNFEPAAEFNAKSAQGGYGVISQGVTLGTGYATSTIGNAVKGIEGAF